MLLITNDNNSRVLYRVSIIVKRALYNSIKKTISASKLVKKRYEANKIPGLI